MKNTTAVTAIIILNWNGYHDTIACLESLFRIPQQNFIWMVVDNGSENESVYHISQFIESKGKTCLKVKEGEKPSVGVAAGEGILYSLSENYGFARGNNIGIALLEELNSTYKTSLSGKEVTLPDHYLLLNNDTEVEPDFLEKLESFSAQHPEYVAMTPQIRYADPSHLVWNCGGKLVFGLRIYYYDKKDYRSITHQGYIPISLITGCALFAKRELLGDPDARLRRRSKAYARSEFAVSRPPRLLTDRFFFGEEDFDLSLRMKEEGKKMACVLDSLIYHKSGATREGFKLSGHYYMHHLNRFVDVRQHWNPVKYFFWKLIYIPYIGYALYRYKVPFPEIRKYLRRLWKDSKTVQGMNRESFRKCIRG